MSDVDFNNGFICGLAVKGTADGDGGKHKCIEVIQFGLYHSLIEIPQSEIKIIPYDGTLKEE